MARKQARELAFQTLFQSEQGKLPLEEVWQERRLELTQAKPQGNIDLEDDTENINIIPVAAETLDFAETILFAFHNHRNEIDKSLQDHIQGWSFNQMAQTDLNVLRLALGEILFKTETPQEVSIEMAIRLAKKYGGKESGRFVNGVLAKVVKQHKSSLN